MPKQSCPYCNEPSDDHIAFEMVFGQMRCVLKPNTSLRNAALIAAAAELLEACKASLALYERLKEASVIPIGGKIETDYNSLKQAIAKAEGRSYA